MKDKKSPLNLSPELQDEIGTAFSLFKIDEDITGRLKTELTLDIKQNLIKTIHRQICIERQHFSILAAINKMASSFQASVTAKNAKQPKLPEILPLKEYQYE